MCRYEESSGNSFDSQGGQRDYNDLSCFLHSTLFSLGLLYDPLDTEREMSWLDFNCRRSPFSMG